MYQTTNQVEADIDNKRAEIGGDLEALEQRVWSVTDWKRHYRRHPLLMLGVAWGGGMLLARAAGGRRRGHNAPHRRAAREGAAAGGKKGETWDNIKGAMVNAAATGFTSIVGRLVPGFRDHYEHLQGANSVPPSSRR